MSAIDHPDYQYEQKRLDYTIGYLKQYYKKITGKKSGIDESIDYNIKHYNNDNLDQFIELNLNSAFQESLSQKINDTERSLSKPYFARVDFIEDGNMKMQNLYIGKMSLAREKDQEVIIIDWRAPIANLYYEGRLGDASFESPDGKVNGQIKLKRQYTIEKAKLKEIFDIDITTNDDFLQAALGSSKDRRLKDIVSTIQSEQNRVIRAGIRKPLIVQGAAGGGKTTIALHRIAYLIYNYKKILSPENFMIIAPNHFFLSYISEVLPDLGVEKVLQTTFEDFAQYIVGKKFKIINPYEKLSCLVNNKYKKSDDESSIIKDVSRFKSSLDYKNMIDDYLKIIESDFIPKEDFKLGNIVLVPYETINSLFVNDYENLPILRRINEIKKTLVNTLNMRKNPIIKDIEQKYDRKIDYVVQKMDDSEKRRKIIIKLADTRDLLMKKADRDSKVIVKKYLSKINKISVIDYYKNFLNDKKIFNGLSVKYIDVKLAERVRSDTLKNIKENKFEMEDLSPLMYLKYRIDGLDEKMPVKHVVIDEAQDFSVFQLFVLKKIIAGNSFTILGDLCQGIYSYRGINDWKKDSESVFGKDNFAMLNLEQSYRTTIEIMNAANKVIGFLHDPKLPPSKPVIRHGEEVKVIQKKSIREVADEIKDKISSLDNEGFQSAAIICKTIDECREISKELKKSNMDIKIISGNEDEYSGGVVLIPSYLVKGLEFDVVIIANANRENYSTDPLDVKLLYIAMTRPLHKLYIYSVGEKAVMLD